MSKGTSRGGMGNAFRRSGVGDPTAGKTGTRSGGAATGVPGLPSLEVDIDGADAEEFEEFMASDWVDVKADPAFRERLRVRLWKMLRDRQRSDTGEHEG